MNVTGNAADVTTYFVLRLAATGVEATGLTIANMDLQYVRTGAAPSAKVDATALAATDTAHTDNYGIEVDATDQPGLYRIDWPDAAFAAGAKQVILTVKCATCFTEHLAVDIDPPVNVTKISDDATAADNCELMFDGTGYAGGTTKLKADLDTIKTQAVTCAAGVTVLASVGTAATSTAQTGDTYALAAGATGFTAIDTVVDAIKVKTDYLPSATAGAAGGVMIAGSNAATTLASLTVSGATVHTGTTTYTGAVTYSDAITATAGPVSMTNASNDIKGVFVATNGIVAASLATGAITNAKFAAGAIDAAAVATGAIDADAIADNAIDAGAIATGAITNAKFAAGAIDATAIANAAIDFATFAADCKTGTGLKANVESVSAGAITATAIADGAIDAATFAAGAIDAAAIATDAIDADALKTDAITEIADGLLNRDMSTGTDSGSPTVRTVRQALRFLRNKWSLSGTTLTVTKEDDSTASWTSTITTDAAANPVTGNDPASS
jgi:hypothetical protein